MTDPALYGQILEAKHNFIVQNGKTKAIFFQSPNNEMIMENPKDWEVSLHISELQMLNKRY